MKKKKEKRPKRNSSSSSSDSTSSSSPSRSSTNKDDAKLERRSVRNKRPAKAARTPDRDLKSKWDSPDERVEKRSLPAHSDKHMTSRDRLSDSRSQVTGNRSDRSRNNKHGDGVKGTSHASKHKDHESNREPGRNWSGGHNGDPSKHRRDYSSADKVNQRERESGHHRNWSRSPQRRNVGRRRRSRSKSFDHSKAVWGKSEQADKKPPEAPKEKEKPNFSLSGKLTEEANTYKGVVIKYSEPPEARKPKRRWRLYPFKGEKAMQTLYIHRESAYLIGRERKVVDLPVDHPSCSKQHAALQYRLVPFTRDNGSVGKRVRPYLIDLDSANGTFINNKKIEARKYVELLERDVIKFGFSSREYVVLHENSKDEAQDDDVGDEAPAADASASGASAEP